MRVKRRDTCIASDSDCPAEVSRLNGLAGGAEQRDAPISDPFAQAASAQERAAPGSALIWVQEVSLPFEPGLPDISSRLLEEADARFARALVGQRYAKGKIALAGKAAGLGLSRHERARVLLFGERDGAYWRYWVARVLDRLALEGDLRLAGVLERQPSTLVIGLLNQGERSEAVQHLADLLQKQRFRFVHLGQGGYGARTQETARKAGVDLVLETRFSLEVGQTRLADNLKRFEARLTVNFYDVDDLLVGQRYTATGSVTDFRETQGADKAVDQAFARIEQDLFASLRRLDEARLAQKSGNTPRAPGS